MTIPTARVKELIKEHDTNPIPELGGLNYYSTYMKILLENENIKDFHEWDYGYTDKFRERAFRQTDKLIKKALDNY